MIRIELGEEPVALVDTRERHLSAAMVTTRKKRSFEGYGVVAGTIRDAHKLKCAYCETWMRSTSGEIEHYRPKGEAYDLDWAAMAQNTAMTRDATDDDHARVTKGRPPVDSTRITWLRRARGYWWLTWTWENFSWACGGCNGSGNKGTRFPLEQGSPVLRPHGQPPGNERPLLLDPCREDPMDHLVYRAAEQGRWRLFAKQRSPKGEWTIQLLQLNDPGLLDRYKDHIEGLDRASQTEQRHLTDNATADARRQAWDALCAYALAPGRELLALAHDWINARWPQHRRAWGLTLTRPALRVHEAPTSPGTLPPLPQRSELEGLPCRLALRVRAQRHLVNLVDERREVIRLLQAHRPELTDAQFASIVNCTESDVARCRE